MARIAVAGLFHESNTFVSKQTRLHDFALRRGQAVKDDLSQTQTVCGGAFASAINAVPVFHGYATPSGPVEAETYELLVSELCARLAEACPVDGVMVELHGAMVAEGTGAADGLTARRVRDAVGDTPLAIVLDPHANLAGGLVESADLVLAYQTNPHEDMATTGQRAVHLLMRVIEGSLDPQTASVRVPVTAPAVAQATADEPLRSVLRLAREVEKKRRCLVASVLFGFAYADVPEQAMAVVAIDERDAEMAEAAAREIADAAWGSREGFRRELATPAEAVEIASTSPGLTGLANIGDNVGGGAPGDSTVIAAELLKRGVPAATTICDPSAVAQCSRAGVGADAVLEFGNPLIRVTGRVLRVADGRYMNDGPLSRGVEFDMGRIAVVETGSLQVVLQTHAVMANDQNMLRSCSIDLGSLKAVDLKGAAAVRAGWASAVERFLDVDTPGPTTANIEGLGLRNIRRPLWPLDGRTDSL